MKHAKLLKKLGNSQITFDAEIYDGDYMDTKVTINGIVICWIAGNTITEFHQELENIIEKYRI